MMKMGAENKKKVWALGVLGVIAAIVLYTNVISDSSPGPAAPSAAKSAVAERSRAAEMPTSELAPAASPERKVFQQRSRSEEFHPPFRTKRPEDRAGLANIDPTVRLDLLEKVQKVALEGGSRNLFQFGAAPPPPKEPLKGPEEKIAVAKAYIYPQPDKPKVVAPPPPPPPEPPIDVKYYGVATTQIDGKKTAFFLDGDIIILAPEGGIVKKKYRVVRINLTSVQMENVDNKKQQSLPLAEDAGANMSN